MNDSVAAQGVAFPRSPDGTRSTTHAGATILAAALTPLSAEQAKAASLEMHWRRKYPIYFRALVESGLVSSERALQSASAGLAAAWDTFQWGENEPVSLRAALGRSSSAPGSHEDGGFETLQLKGRGDPEVARWTVPYRGEQLGGESLRARLVDWQNRGIIEPGAVRALLRCAANPQWFDLSDRTLVLLGAGSEAGPLRWLMRWRANVVAVEMPRAAIWHRIADIAYSGNGRLIVPIRRGAGRSGTVGATGASGKTEASVAAGAGSAVRADDAQWFAAAGADLISDAPDLARWLASLDRPLDIGALAYLDGERHVRVTMGMDMIAQALTERDARHSLAFLATPTDVFAVAQETADAAIFAYLNRPVTSRTLQSPLRLASGDRFFQPNIERLVESGNGRQYGVVDSLVLEQGPNYALAKRIQQWRALKARAAGHRVSLNVAPSTTTASVIKNPALAAGFKGASSFGIEAFEPHTTNALMAALWVHDLRSDEAAANPAVPLAHPFELFMANACHGGLWRCAYLPRSALPFAAALGWVRNRLGG